MYDLRIDGDLLVYRAGFAADSRGGAVSHSLYNIKLLINTVKEKFTPNEPVIYLTSRDPKANFRTEVPTYKANRARKCIPCESSNMEYSFSEYGVVTDERGAIKRVYSCNNCGYQIPDSKPVYYKEMREYLTSRLGAIICQWGEADDWLCTDVKTNTIIVSNDKDLLMAPGYHYRLSSGLLLRSYDPGKLYLSKDSRKLLGVGFKWFAAQMILGDRVDNIIKPKAGMGSKAVYNLLNKLDTIEQLWDTVTEFYKKEGKEDQILINGKLLWMARKPEQIFSYELVEELIHAQKLNK